MRFIHTADIHLDSPLAGLSLRAGERATEFVKATRHAFIALIDFALDQRVDFVVIAGDLYDGDWKDFSTGLFFVRQLARLEPAGIRVVMALGNHDAESKMTRSLSLPAHCRQFDSRKAETILWDDLGVALHGRSYKTQREQDNLARDFPPARPGVLNIGVLHTSLSGRPGHEPYAPCNEDELRAKGYDYWALGHVHAREVVCEDPWIVFPGNLQGRHANETGAKGCTLVTVEDQRIVAVEAVALDVLRWAKPVVDLSAATTWDDAAEAMRGALERAVAEAGNRPLAVRLTLTGRTPLHRRLLGHPDRLIAEAEGAAARAGADIWIERVVVGTAEPQEVAAVASDAVGELLRTVQAVQEDPVHREQLRQSLTEVLGKLPSAILAEAGLAEIGDDVLAHLLDDAQAILLDRLLGEESQP